MRQLVNTLQDDNGYKVYWENAVQVCLVYAWPINT